MGVFGTLVCLVLGIPVGISLMAGGFLGLLGIFNWDIFRAMSILGSSAYFSSARFELCVIPLFIVMGLFAMHTGSSEAAYRSAYKLFGRIPGSLSIATLMAAALFGAIVNTARAIAEALPNIPLSVAVGIAGAGQVAAIASQPLPELAEGGIAYGDTIARVGEYQGAGVNPEVIAPLNKLESMLGMNTVNVVGTISGEDIVLASERFGERANRLD